MAQSTPLRALSNIDPVTFSFSPSAGANVAIHFYDVSGLLIPPGSGTVTLTASIPTASYAGAVSDPTPLPLTDWEPATPAQVCAANVTYTLDFGSGAGNVKLTPSAVTPPGSGVFYTVKISLAPTRPPEPLT